MQDSGFLDVPNARLYYEVAGAGPAGVFVHGFTLDARMWDDSGRSSESATASRATTCADLGERRRSRCPTATWTTAGNSEFLGHRARPPGRAIDGRNGGRALRAEAPEARPRACGRGLRAQRPYRAIGS